MDKLSHKYDPSVILYEGAVVSESATIGPYSIIYPGVTIEDNVHISTSVIIGKQPSVGRNQVALSIERGNVVIGSGTFVGDQVIVYAGASIGQNCYLADKSLIREGAVISDLAVIGTGVVISFDAKIGRRSKVMTGTNICGNMQIGDDVFVGVHVCCVTDNAPYEQSPRSKHRGPSIDHGAFIGSNVTILPGVRVARNVTVAAASVITRDLTEAGSTYMGSPAKLFKGGRI